MFGITPLGIVVAMGVAALALCAVVSSPVAEAAPPGTTFYLNAQTGDDQNDGRTPQKAWRSLAKVNALTLAPGDHVVLAEGGEFAGHLELQASDAGTPDRPIVIRGAGARRATIVSPERTAISVASGGIEIRDLVLQGKAAEKKKGHNGVALYASGDKGERYPHVRLHNLEIVGFGDSGLTLGSEHESQPGFDDVLITNVKARGNYGAGIITFDKPGDRTKGYAHRGIVVRDCDASGNRAGSGIILSGIERGLVEYCRASDNDGPGGGVGIWAYAAKNVRFRYCIASGTRTRGKDGGGFDLDGACDGCVVENCLSYDNDGPGYMHCDYPTAQPTKNNVIRASISINDGRYQEKANATGFGFVTWGSGLDDCHITGNLTLLTKPNAQDAGAAGAMFVAYLTGSQGQDDVLHIRGCTATNNVVIVSAPGLPFVGSDLPKATTSDVRFSGNVYQTRGTAAENAPLFVWDGQRYTSLAAWRTATGQETTGDGKRAAPQTKRDAPPEVTEATYALTKPRDLPGFPLMKWLVKPATRK